MQPRVSHASTLTTILAAWLIQGVARAIIGPRGSGNAAYTQRICNVKEVNAGGKSVRLFIFVVVVYFVVFVIDICICLELRLLFSFLFLGHFYM